MKWNHTNAELKGIRCLELEFPAPRKQIVCSRSFAGTVEDLNTLESAVGYLATHAVEKLRRKSQYATSITTYTATNRFVTDNYYGNAYTIKLPHGINDYLTIAEAALNALRTVYKNGLNYKKAGVELSDLTENVVYDMFSTPNEKRIKLSNAIDKINEEYGRNSIKVAPICHLDRWTPLAQNLSNSFTSRILELEVVNL